MFRFFQDAVHGLDYGGLVRHGAKFVVEDGLAYDVQRDAAGTQANKINREGISEGDWAWAVELQLLTRVGM